MLIHELKLADLALKLRESAEALTLPSKIWIYRKRTVVIDLTHNQERLAFDWVYSDEGWTGSVLGRTDSARRLLRNSLIGSYEMARDNGERHIIGTIRDAGTGAEDRIYKTVRDILDLVDKQTTLDGMTEGESDCVNVFWWDGKPNFGDVIGPWLVSEITQKRPINGRSIKRLSPPIMTVGSILNMLEQDGTVVWGSGLMDNLSEQAAARLRCLDNVSVRAVRGKLTRSELIKKLGWEVPEIYGDPALLLPRFLPVRKPINDKAKRIAIVPHYVHTAYFKNMESESINIIDVHDGMERVVRQIANSTVCISTSLHGLIIAQAYGVPWVWVRVIDNQLGGDTFKFRDFFSTLDSSVVSSIDVAKGDIGKLNIEEVARSASLPELQISLDALLSSFPQMHAGDLYNTTGRSRRSEKVNETAQDLNAVIAALIQKMDALSTELVEQRALLERLTDAP